uniref:Uncharacterized protein n=1 Tax=Cyclophora tenuis TaxID=216820 RepID=A0A7S1GQI2_CYCTE
MVSHNDDDETTSLEDLQLVVVFGRPGAGKTTIADAAIEKLGGSSALGLDLDVCIPQWMKDNFSNGIYPTLEQRQEFMKDSCRYVQDQINQTTCTIILVSFSFVNVDLRQGFRKAFPNSKWALVDTTEEEAELRIQQRKGHFYTGAPKSEEEEEEEEEDKQQKQQAEEDPQQDSTSSKADKAEDKDDDGDDNDNSEWLFAPVTFEHTILPGTASIEENAQRVVDILV